MTNIIQKSSINWDMIMIWNAIGYITNNLKKKMWWSHLKDMLVNGDHHPISMVENSKKNTNNLMYN